MSISETGRSSVDLDEAAPQLEQAAHDAQVAYDCIRLGDLDWAHTNAITACVEAAAAAAPQASVPEQIPAAVANPAARP